MAHPDSHGGGHFQPLEKTESKSEFGFCFSFHIFKLFDFTLVLLEKYKGNIFVF